VRQQRGGVLALVQPEEKDCGVRGRALQRRRSRAHAWRRRRLVGLRGRVREAQERRDAHRAGDDLRGALLSDVAPQAPAARVPARI
ncbi:MAG: hypothetical protein AVDCRST_MAG01-01-3835, partial [uncultured Rubrobacteraceae bacterium]